MTGYKERFFKDFAEYHGIPKDVVIDYVEQECFYYEGCPTCGGEYTYEVTITGTRDGKRYCESVSGKISDFINSL